jgi:5-methylcytosine-specific restriction protein A
MPTKEEFRDEVRAQLREAARNGAEAITLSSGAVHRALGGYPGPKHQMPPCCEAMYDEMRPGDEIVEAPPKGRGATLSIRYKLPR